MAQRPGKPASKAFALPSCSLCAHLKGKRRAEQWDGRRNLAPCEAAKRKGPWRARRGRARLSRRESSGPPRQPHPPRTRRPASPCSASPAISSRQRTATPCRSEVSLASAATESIVTWPPPSTTTETFGPSRSASPAADMAERMRSATGSGSAISRGPARQADRSPPARRCARRCPASSTSSANACGGASDKPRNLQAAARCHLDHAVAVARRRFAQSDQAVWAKALRKRARDAPTARRRSASAPKAPGTRRAAKAAGASCRQALPSAHWRLRRSARRDRRRRNCAAGATGRAAAPQPTARR